MILETIEEDKLTTRFEMISPEKLKKLAAQYESGSLDSRINNKIKRIETLINCSPSSSILDLYCGVGFESVEMARKGYKVLGMDCCNKKLKIALEAALKKKTTLTLQLGDLRDFDFKEQMDFVLLRDVVFGTCKEVDNNKIIANISRALKPRGRCLFEVYNKEFAMKFGVENRFFYHNETDCFLLKEEYKPARLESLKLYSIVEWRKMLGINQLKIVKTDGWSMEGDPGPPPHRVDFIVAEKI